MFASVRSGVVYHWGLLVFGAFVAGVGPAHATQPDSLKVQDRSVRTLGVPTDSAEVAAVVDRFHRALTEGDSAAVLDLLAADALILEAGAIETIDEYRAHHLSADIAFARAVPRERGPIRVAVRGDVAWATSSSRNRGEFQGRTINSEGAELMVLVRSSHGWRIAAVHWSSRTLRS